jgi:hypothetical protein
MVPALPAPALAQQTKPNVVFIRVDNVGVAVTNALQCESGCKRKNFSQAGM